MTSSDSQTDKLQRGRPKRAELLDVNRNTGAQSIKTERASLILRLTIVRSFTQTFVTGFFADPA